jgi:probable rRNA maturation factor
MKIHWDDRGKIPVKKSMYATLKQAAVAVLKTCFEDDEIKKIKYEVSISFVSDEEIRDLNLKYREMDAATDVLSFPTIGMPPPGEIFPMGDVVVSTETAARQAEEYGHSFERELAFLMIHGLLHLVGLNHEEDPADLEIMEEMQEAILAELGLAR